MSTLLRIIALDECVEDVRRLRACMSGLANRRVSVQHLPEAHGAIDRLAKMRADVLFIDEDLSRVTGVETIASLRAAGEVRPIVATTRSDCGYLAAQLIQAGSDGYLAKDDLHTTLVERVLAQTLRTARSRQANDRLRRSAVRRLVAQHGEAVMGLG